MKPETAASRWHRVRVKASKVGKGLSKSKDAKAQQLAFQHWIEAPGKYVWLTYKEVYDNVIKLGNSICSCGLAEPGKYVWLTYKEVYDNVIKLGNSIRSCGLAEGGRCGIFGANCPEWIISMQVGQTE